MELCSYRQSASVPPALKAPCPDPSLRSSSVVPMAQGKESQPGLGVGGEGAVGVTEREMRS